MAININRRIFFYLGITIFILLLLLLSTSSLVIGRQVNQLCLTARTQYQGDCVSALVSQLEDNNQPFRNRNHAIWALGQLGDSRALPVLQSYFTGHIPNREPLDQSLSQYELKKAIKLISSGLNITAPFWRHFLAD